MSRRLLPAATAEFVATAALVFFVTGALVLDRHLAPDGYGLLGVSLAAGAAYAGAVLVCRRAGGGHANPAVSIAAYLTGRTDAVRAGVYVLAQSAGGVLGAAFARALLPRAAGEATSYGLAQAAAGTPVLTALTLELVLTFFLALALFAALLDGPPAAGAVAVGAAAMAGTLLVYPITGAAMNPARAFGPALLEGVWRGQWIYLVGPVLGATLAGAVHDGVMRDVDDAPETVEEE